MIWNVETWKSTPLETGQAGEMDAVCFDPHSTHIATASADNSVRVLDVLSGKAKLTLSGGGHCHGVVFTPDGRRVVSASGLVKVWDTVSGQETLTLRGTKAAQVINAVAISPDGSKIVACTRDGDVILWDSQL
jgi:WD40 repeat protein